VKVEPIEFTSSGGRGEALSRRAKSRFLDFARLSKIEKPAKPANRESVSFSGLSIPFRWNKIPLLTIQKKRYNNVI
jgi:hypothetical protein